MAERVWRTVIGLDSEDKVIRMVRFQVDDLDRFNNDPKLMAAATREVEYGLKHSDLNVVKYLFVESDSEGKPNYQDLN